MPTKTATKKQILSVKVFRQVDEYDDTSYLGTFSNKQDAGIYTIEHVSHEHGAYHYFNPYWQKYEGCTQEEIKAYCQRDYERACDYGMGWYMLGIYAKAEVIFNDTIQTIGTSGLWGIESDSDKSYFQEVQKEQLEELRGKLAAAGFSKSAIDKAFANAEVEI